MLGIEPEKKKNGIYNICTPSILHATMAQWSRPCFLGEFRESNAKPYKFQVKKFSTIENKKMRCLKG